MAEKKYECITAPAEGWLGYTFRGPQRELTTPDKSPETGVVLRIIAHDMNCMAEELEQLKSSVIEILSWYLEDDLIADAEIADEMDVIDEIVDIETDDEANWRSTKLKAAVSKLKEILGGNPFSESSDFTNPPEAQR